jgi:hypothetical protein
VANLACVALLHCLDYVAKQVELLDLACVVLSLSIVVSFGWLRAFAH